MFVKIPGAVLISLFFFSPEESTAVLTITRSGIYGSIVIDWTTGQLAAGLPPGVSNGQITPATGSLSMSHGEESKNFTVQVMTSVSLQFNFAFFFV